MVCAAAEVDMYTLNVERCKFPVNFGNCVQTMRGSMTAKSMTCTMPNAVVSHFTSQKKKKKKKKRKSDAMQQLFGFALRNSCKTIRTKWKKIQNLKIFYLNIHVAFGAEFALLCRVLFDLAPTMASLCSRVYTINHRFSRPSLPFRMQAAASLLFHVRRNKIRAHHKLK